MQRHVGLDALDMAEQLRMGVVKWDDNKKRGGLGAVSDWEAQDQTRRLSRNATGAAARSTL